jgi:pimeloyl-ACP methyl ester carboxylesterase
VPKVTANGLQIEVETQGNPSDPAVMLIMGLGMQLVAWPDEFCQNLVDAGYYVIRFDNRDVGLSEKINDGRKPNLPLAMIRYVLHLPVSAPYLIDAMAADAIGVLDALNIREAHLVGASLGGMIAQSMAANYPKRCLSLTSIMSSSGDRRLPNASWRATKLLMVRPPANATVDQLADHLMRVFEVIGSPGFPASPKMFRDRLSAAITRGYCPEGFMRQLLAVLASGDRSATLKTIGKPTLVIHGDSDQLVPVAHGIDSARKIPGAKLKIIPGMGHDLAPGLIPIISEALVAHLRSAAQ